MYPQKMMWKGGRDLAETDVILLMKLEQAYLHIIELSKRIEALENQQKNELFS